MTDEEVKWMCKWIVQNSNRPLTNYDKEIVKKMINEAKTINDLFEVALSVVTVQ